MTRFILAPEAVQDLNGIWEYIADDNPDAADRFLERLRQALLTLTRTPGIGHARKDLAGHRPILFWPVGEYLILYRITKKQVEIVAVGPSTGAPGRECAEVSSYPPSQDRWAVADHR